MHPRKFWTAADDALLRRVFAHQPTDGVAAMLGRTSAAVASHARAIGLTKTRQYRSATTSRTSRERSPWTPEIEELMVLLYPCCMTGQLQDLFGIPSAAIRQKAMYMGLKKNTAAKRQIAQLRQLAPGDPSWQPYYASAPIQPDGACAMHLPAGAHPQPSHPKRP